MLMCYFYETEKSKFQTLQNLNNNLIFKKRKIIPILFYFSTLILIPSRCTTERLW
jgi:hypothetical protein